MVFLCPPGSDDTITLNEVGSPPQRGGVDHFGFRLADKGDLTRAIEEVEAHGGKLVERGEHAPGVEYAYVTDPDGHMIEL